MTLTVKTEYKLNHYEFVDRKVFVMDANASLVAITRRAKYEHGLNGKLCKMHHKQGCICMVFSNATLCIDFECNVQVHETTIDEFISLTKGK